MNLKQYNQSQIDYFRQQLIEKSFTHSQQHHYKMPRKPSLTDSLSLEDIPNLYNLHSQNHNTH